LIRVAFLVKQFLHSLKSELWGRRLAISRNQAGRAVAIAGPAGNQSPGHAWNQPGDRDGLSIGKYSAIPPSL
jgi:hypothetical protein